MGSLMRIYTCADGMQAHFLKQLLAQEGIAAVIEGEELSQVAGGLGTLAAMRPRLLVPEELAGRAGEVLAEYEERSRATPVWRSEPWVCPRCGEEVEGQFTMCWACEAERPGLDTPAMNREELARTDPALSRDILCIECQYNLRGLEIRNRCPECGGPVLQSVLNQLSVGDMDTPDESLRRHFDAAAALADGERRVASMVMMAWVWDAAREQGNGHPQAKDILAALRDVAIHQFGMPGDTATFRQWGIANGADVASLLEGLACARVIPDVDPAILADLRRASLPETELVPEPAKLPATSRQAPHEWFGILCAALILLALVYAIWGRL